MPKKKSQINSKKFERSVKQIVRKELDEELEDKNAIVSYEDTFINSSIPTGTVFNNQGNFFRLLAQIEQSTQGEAGRKYNSRIGNEITLKHLDINGYLSYSYATTGATSNYQNAKLAVRVMIVRAKKYNQYDIALDDMPTNMLLTTASNASGNVGAYTGLPLDSFSAVNRDAFAVRYDKVHYLNAPTITYGTTSTDISSIPSANKIFKHRLTFGKNGLKLTYSNTNATEPENFPYFMVIGYSSMSGSTTPGNSLVRMSLFSKAVYQDA